MPQTKSRTAGSRRASSKHVPGDQREQIERRDRLADLLTEAAQIEHDVMVQYLFAAFSLKKSVSEGSVTYAQLEKMRGWATTMLMVARQEMEHLGLVSNLLTAIGEAPTFRRPEFPVPATTFPTNLPSSLDRFSADTVLRFVCYEMPRQVDKKDHAYLSKHIPNFNPARFDGIYRTYVEIRKLFEEIEPDDLFIGPPSAQFLSGGNSVLVRGRIFPQKNTGVQQQIYDISMIPVTGLDSARKVIDQIIEEGEGANEASTTSHFARFLEMHQELTAEMEKDHSFQPARNVVSNPRVDASPGALVPGLTPVTNRDTQQVMRLFDLAYGAMLLMLMRYFAATHESAADLIGLQDTAFFPMMTVGIRPLGEILTQLPAHEPGLSFRAGPSFYIDDDLQLLPHRKSAWRVILGQLQLLTVEAEKAQKNQAFSPEIRQRLALAYENFARMSMNFEDAMHAREMK